MILFSEQGQFLVGKKSTDGNGVTVQGARVLANDCDELMVCVHLAEGTGATSANQATITVEEATAYTGGTNQTITQESYLLMNGATAMTAGTGLFTNTKHATLQSTIQSLAADGAKEQLFCIPIRTRRMSNGFKYLSAKVTGLTAARPVSIYYVKAGLRYGMDQAANVYT